MTASPRVAVRIAPTGAGAVFLLVVLSLILAAINYGNNVLYALAFFLAATGTASAWPAWRAVAGLVVGAPRLDPAFAGGRAVCALPVADGAGRSRRALALATAAGTGAPAHLGPRASLMLAADVPAPRRGAVAARRLRVVSTWPFGLFRAWRPLTAAPAAPVYPALETVGPHSREAWRDAGRVRAESETFSHFRDYAAGDAPSRIHWKALARGDALLTKVFDGAAGGHAFWLDWRDAAGSAGLGEATLSRLARWVVEADAHDLDYGLRLPGLEIAPARGAVQRVRCLEALARVVLENGAPAGKRKPFFKRGPGTSS